MEKAKEKSLKSLPPGENSSNRYFERINTSPSICQLSFKKERPPITTGTLMASPELNEWVCLLVVLLYQILDLTYRQRAQRNMLAATIIAANIECQVIQMMIRSNNFKLVSIEGFF